MLVDWEMEDVDPDSIQEMVWVSAPSLTSKQLEGQSHETETGEEEEE